MIPTYDQFIEPVLRFLAAHPEGAKASDVHDAVATSLGLNDNQLNELLPSGGQLIYKNRAGWAHDRLKRAGLSTSVRRGFWKISPAGIDFANHHAPPLHAADVERLAVGFTDVRLGPPKSEVHVKTTRTVPFITTESRLSSPDDRLGEAVGELRDAVRSELLDVLKDVSPSFFETIVLDLLHKMGYGATRADLQKVGGVSDAGIDGIISLDKLGLEKVYVQAKRWQGNVGRPDIHSFYGALAGQHAKKGVFITTSGFTKEALEFADSVSEIVLVDGARLTELMIDHEVGITSRMVRVPKLDSDYFDEESQ